MREYSSVSISAIIVAQGGYDMDIIHVLLDTSDILAS